MNEWMGVMQAMFGECRVVGEKGDKVFVQNTVIVDATSAKGRDIAEKYYWAIEFT